METWLRIQAGLGGWVLLIPALLVLFILIRISMVLRRRRRWERRAAEGAELAASLGWEHRLGDTARVELDEWSGALHGVAWQLQVRASMARSSSRQQARYTRWRTADLQLPEGFVAVMAIPADARALTGATYQLGGPGAGLARAIAHRATQLFLKTYLSATFGVEGGEVLGALPSVSKWTPPELAATHTVISSDEQLARGFLAAPVDGLFLKWLEHAAGALPGRAGIPAALAWRGGLMLGFPTAVRSPEELQRVVALGAAICVLSRERPIVPEAAPAPLA